MNTITISNYNKETFTSISNIFIDNYMADANGEFVKVYIFLSKLVGCNTHMTITEIADLFNCTEKDICRAIKYWVKKELIQLEYNTNKELTGITLLPLKPSEQTACISAIDISAQTAAVSAPDISTQTAVVSASNVSTQTTAVSAFDISTQTAAPDIDISTQAAISTSELNNLSQLNSNTGEEMSYDNSLPRKSQCSPHDIATHKAKKYYDTTVYQIEIYFGRTLTAYDHSVFIYILDELHFSEELFDYLIEYCVSKEKANIRYMEAVAINWYKEKITTKKQAETHSALYNSTHMAILKALGIQGRVTTNSEAAYINTWYNTFKFSNELVLAACKKANLSSPTSASFPYVNGILENWKKHNVKSIKDVEALDLEWIKANKIKKAGKTDNNQFNQFSQRTYDYDKIDEMFLQEVNSSVAK